MSWPATRPDPGGPRGRGSAPPVEARRGLVLPRHLSRASGIDHAAQQPGSGRSARRHGAYPRRGAGVRFLAARAGGGDRARAHLGRGDASDADRGRVPAVRRRSGVSTIGVCRSIRRSCTTGAGSRGKRPCVSATTRSAKSTACMPRRTGQSPRLPERPTSAAGARGGVCVGAADARQRASGRARSAETVSARTLLSRRRDRRHDRSVLPRDHPESRHPAVRTSLRPDARVGAPRWLRGRVRGELRRVAGLRAG